MYLPEGAQLGRYKITALVGGGGMGEVYLAEDTTLERRVALKILPPAIARGGERMARFVREAKAASALNHPNIAHVYEIGEAREGAQTSAAGLVTRREDHRVIVREHRRKPFDGGGRFGRDRRDTSSVFPAVVRDPEGGVARGQGPAFGAFYRPFRGKEGAEALGRPPPPPDRPVVLFYYVVEVLDPPQLTVKGQDFLLNGGCESLRLGGMFIRGDSKRQPPMVSSHQLLEESYCRGNVPFS